MHNGRSRLRKSLNICRAEPLPPHGLTQNFIYPISLAMNMLPSPDATLVFQRITPDFPELDRVQELACEAFPPEERVSAKDLLHLAGEGTLDFWALLHRGEFAGYLSVLPYRNMAYLSFFAIVAGKRVHGLGSAALSALREHYPAHILTVDLEPLDEAATNRDQRIRRRHFYLRNGFLPTGWFLSYAAGTFEILCACGPFDILLFQRLMLRIQEKVPTFHPIFSRTGNIAMV